MKTPTSTAAPGGAAGSPCGATTEASAVLDVLAKDDAREARILAHDADAGVACDKHQEASLAVGESARIGCELDEPHGRQPAEHRDGEDADAPAGNLGLSWAAFMLGIPTTSSVDANDSYATVNPYYSGSLMSGYKSNRFNWLAEASVSSWESGD